MLAACPHPLFLTAQDEIEHSAGKFSARGAVAIVVNPAGEVLLNLRDDKPDILHPNRWSVLGGRCDEGEPEEIAVRRELVEEAAIEAEDVIPGWQFIDRHGHRHLLTAFIVPTRLSLEEMTLSEGQDMRFFSKDALADLTLAPFVDPLLTTFFETCRGDRNATSGTWSVDFPGQGEYS